MSLLMKNKFEIDKLSEGIDFNNLTYHFMGESTPRIFISFEGPLVRYNNIKNGRVSLQKEKNSRRISIRAKLIVKRKSEL